MGRLTSRGIFKSGGLDILPKKIYLNYVDENDEYKTWSEDPAYVYCDMQNREYTDLSQVWHDAKEEPEEKRLIVCIDDDGASIYKLTDQVEGAWLCFAECFGLIRWAYIDDLLPEGGEQ